MSGIKIIPPVVIPQFPEAPGAGAPKPAGKENFGDFLKNAVNEINGLQDQSAEAQEKMMRGEAAELHQVMIAAEKAGISFDLLLEIRKKLLDAYQDIIRMPV